MAPFIFTGLVLTLGSFQSPNALANQKTKQSPVNVKAAQRPPEAQYSLQEFNVVIGKTTFEEAKKIMGTAKQQDPSSDWEKDKSNHICYVDESSDYAVQLEASESDKSKNPVIAEAAIYPFSGSRPGDCFKIKNAKLSLRSGLKMGLSPEQVGKILDPWFKFDDSHDLYDYKAEWDEGSKRTHLLIRVEYFNGLLMLIRIEKH